MWVTRATIVLVAVAVVTSDGLDKSLQSLDHDGAEKLHPGNTTLLREFYDHAEYKSQSQQGEDTTKDFSTTTEIPELLPTPVPMKLKEPDAEFIASEKKPSVPKKGVTYKPSVVPKKGVHFTPSVVAKKGADPESSTPSVSPRKGVELTQENPVLSPGSTEYDMLTVSGEIHNTNVSLLSSNIKDKSVQAKINSIGNEADNDKEISSNIHKSQNVDEKFKSSINVNLSKPPTDSNTTVGTVMPSGSVKVLNTAHFKPTTADDPSASSNQISYVPIFMIVALVVLIVVVVAVGYHKLKDIWARRHYNYVDFLIDGMYE